MPASEPTTTVYLAAGLGCPIVKGASTIFPVTYPDPTLPIVAFPLAEVIIKVKPDPDPVTVVAFRVAPTVYPDPATVWFKLNTYSTPTKAIGL